MRISAKMGHAVHERAGSLFATSGITSAQEVGVIAVRGRIRYFVAVRSADPTERLVVTGELIHGPRLEAVII